MHNKSASCTAFFYKGIISAIHLTSIIKKTNEQRLYIQTGCLKKFVIKLISQHTINMFKLSLSLRAWNSRNFNAVLKKEIGSLAANHLPLQQGLSYSSYAIGDNVSARIINVESNNEFILAKAGLFYTGVIAGCNCDDDPSPVDELNEYCEVLFSINKQTAEATVTFLTDSNTS